MRVVIAVTAFLMSVSILASAKAQLMLHGDSPASGGSSAAPGGTGGLKSGAVSSSAAAAPPAKAKPVPMKAPSEESVLNHDLLRNGANGLIALGRQGKDIDLLRLSLEGESISKPGELCHIDINEGLPIALRPLGRPEGLARYQADLPACPFSFDVLEGAVLVPKGHACDFTAADCHVDPAGLWGPQGNTISPARVKEMEQARIRIEMDMRANYRVLLAHAGKDKAAVKRIAGEQAGFSSERETLCHSYALESVHGFCALESTRARVLALLAQLGAVSDEPGELKPPRKKKPKPPAIAVVPPAAPAPDEQ